MRTAAVLLLLAAVSAGCAESRPPSCRLANDVVEEAIARKARELQGNEYCQFRKYDGIHDYDGDGKDDLIVSFNVEGTGGGGNNVVAFLYAFLSSRASSPPFELPMGEREQFLPISITADRTDVVVVTVQQWVPGDPSCCPTGEGEIRVLLHPERGLSRAPRAGA